MNDDFIKRMALLSLLRDKLDRGSLTWQYVGVEDILKGYLSAGVMAYSRYFINWD